MHYQDRFRRREFERQMSAVADEIEMRLATTIDHEFRYIDEGERRAGLDAVAGLFATANLSDQAIFEVDVDPIALAQMLRESDDRHQAIGLSEEGEAYYNRILFESCACLLGFVRQLPEFEPRAHVETLRRLSTLSEQVRLGFQQLPRPARSDASFDEDNYFLQRYLAYVSRAFDEIELFGIDPRDTSNWISLSIAYLSLTVSRGTNLAMASRAAIRRGDQAPLGEPKSRLRVESALADGRLTIVRGEAGSGKTTLLKWLAIQASRASFNSPLKSWNNLVPIFLPLRKLLSSELPPPSEWLRFSAPLMFDVEPDKWTLRQLRLGRVLLLVDGVDELSPAQRRNVAHWLRQLLSLHELRIVVTSRPTAVPVDWLSDVGFRDVMIEPMNADDIGAFVRHWHEAIWQVLKRDEPLRISRDQIDEHERALSRQLDAQPHLRNLAISPLLCAMLCALNFGRRGYLPRDRMDLYNAVLELLLETRDTARGIPSAQDFPLTYRQKLYLLQGLAWRLAERTRSELPADKAIAWTDARLRPLGLSGTKVSGPEAIDFLLLRSGVIREPAPGRIDFIHRSFLEYLAGKEAADEDHVDLLVARAHLDHWREIVVMAASHGRPQIQEELLNGIIERSDTDHRHARALRLVAIACLDAVTSLSDRLQQRLLDCLARCIPPRNVSEARSVAAAGNVLLRHLPDSLENYSAPAAAAVVRTVIYIGGAESLKILARYGADQRRRVIAELVDGWPYYDADEYATRVLADSPLPGGSLSVVGMRTLKAAGHLRHLRNLDVRISVNDIDELHHVEKLSTLVVDGRIAATSTPPDFRVLRELPDLRRLMVEAAVPAGAVRQMRDLTRLTHLHLRFSSSPPDLSFLSELGQLTSLHLRPLHDTVEISSIGDLTALRELSIRGMSPAARFGPGVLPGSLVDLTLAEVYDRELTSRLAELRSLERLRVFQTDHLTDLSVLGDLDLTELWLRDCNAVAELSTISRFQRLRTLVFMDCPGTDLDFLSRLPHLRQLFVRSDGPLDLSLFKGHPGQLDVFLGHGQEVTGDPGSRLSLLRLDALELKWVKGAGWTPGPAHSRR
ncbi:NACHT domain-containing protein [Actinoplanes sp. NPDC051861]|uniref:NACHT domain-containing protein n=1 Tax=Actinoplanes sp. NPDC051861 TaxID=3155170 RepID=UPI003418DC8E